MSYLPPNPRWPPENSLCAQALMVYDNLHERYHFIERHVPINKNEVINA